ADQRLERLVDREHDVEFLVQETRIGLDMPRLVNDLRRGVEFGVDALDLLHDLGGADQRALLAVHELRNVEGLEIAPQLGDPLWRQAVPQVAAIERDGLVRQHHRVFGVEILLPVDPVRRVPLLALALLIERQQVGARLVVFPGKRGLQRRLEPPTHFADGKHVTGFGRHRHSSLPWTSTAIAAVDVDITVGQVARPDGGLAAADAEIDVDDNVAPLHVFRHRRFVVVRHRAAILRDQHAADGNAKGVTVDLLARLADRHDDAAPIRVARRDSRLDQGRIADGETDGARRLGRYRAGDIDGD